MGLWIRRTFTGKTDLMAIPTPSRHVTGAQHWRERAAHMRALSLMMRDVDAQAIMQKLANDYDELADRAAARGTGNIPKPINKTTSAK